MFAQGLLELGGRNCTIRFVSTTGQNRMGSIVGMAYFTQYFYWFPMAHFINLAVSPCLFVGLDSDLRIVQNYKVLSKAKPSVYAYPKEVSASEATTAKKTQTAVLSTHARVQARGKKAETQQTEETKEDQTTTAANGAAAVEPVPEEPADEELTNPFRIVPKQLSVVQTIPHQNYAQIVPGRYQGFVILKKTNPKVVPIYYDEEISRPKPAVTEQPPVSSSGNQYQPIPTSDVEMPEEFSLR